MKHRFKTLSATCHAVASERKRELLETAVQTAAAEARRADIFVENGISINPKLRQERYILLSHRTLTMSLLTELGKSLFGNVYKYAAPTALLLGNPLVA